MLFLVVSVPIPLALEQAGWAGQEATARALLALAFTAVRGIPALCAGVFAMLAFEVVQNLAMNLRLAPITGIALPFVSYGGSSMMTSMLGVGLVQAVALHHGRRR